MDSGSCVIKVNSASREGPESQPHGCGGGNRQVRQGCQTHRGVEQRRSAIRLREMTQVWPHGYWEPCNDQEEQWDGVVPEPEPTSTTQFRSQNWQHVTRDREGGGQRIHLGVRKYGSHHGRCPANSTMLATRRRFRSSRHEAG